MIELPQGALIWQPDLGLGADDGRVGPMTAWVHAESHRFRGQRILDLGSNCGQMPLEYCKAGAAHVTAVEGKKQFLDVFHQIRGAWPIFIQPMDVRQIIIPHPFDIVSCLGLIYHVEGIWASLSRIVTEAEPTLLLIESEIYAVDFQEWEDGSAGDASKSLKRELCLRPTPQSIETEMETLGFKPTRIIFNAPLYVRGMRGFWVGEKI